MAYSNSAGRVLKLLEAAKNLGNSNTAQYAQAYGVENTQRAVLAVHLALLEELELLKHQIDSFKDNKTKYDLYLANFPNIERSVKGFVLNLHSNAVQAIVDDSGLVALRFIAADLPQEEIVSDAAIQDLFNKLEELRTIASQSDLSLELKQWLLEIVSIMKVAIERYRLRGGRGATEQFHQLLGELLTHYPQVQELKQKKPDLWNKVTSAIQLVSKMAEVVEKMTKAITAVSNALPFLNDLGKHQ